MSEQREYNLCPGCGKTSTAPQRGGYQHGGISWHPDCIGRRPLTTKLGLVEALRACETQKEQLEVFAARDRLDALNT